MKIAIFQPMLKQYRVQFTILLAEKLRKDGNEIRFIFGSPPPKEQVKNDNVVLNVDYCCYPRSYWLFGNRLHYLKGATKHILWADLVITEQANKHVFNYLLVLLHLLRLKKFAYWGHGQNRQGNSKSLRERIKKRLSTYCDWWFAYTKGVADYLRKMDYPSDKISIINNSNDTNAFRTSLNEIIKADVQTFKIIYNLDENARIGIYCGSLYPDKKIRFLLEVAVYVNNINPDFILLVAGGGIDQSIVLEYSKKYEFIKYIGPVFGHDKALAFNCAEIFLHPGAIGLGILDAFTAGLPVLTTDLPTHGPEIDYLHNNTQGIITAHDINDYADCVLSIIDSPDQMKQFKQNALMSSRKYSLENMTENFAQGIRDFRNHYRL